MLLRSFLAVYDYVVYLIGMLLFAAIFLSWSLLAAVLRPLLAAPAGRRLGRAAIMLGFRFCLRMLALSGRFHFDLRELDALRQEKSLIIAANHPSLWDVVLIISRLPNVACIMKAELVNNIFLGGGARLAGYIRNESLRRMIMQAVEELQRGSQLLLFPEGTRTVKGPLNTLKGSIGAIAARAQVPVQTIFIETDSAFLAKGWPFWKKPALPIRYRVRLGQRFMAPENSAPFVAELEQYFVREIDARAAVSTVAAHDARSC